MKDSDFDKWAASYDDGMKDDTTEFPFIGYYDVLSEIERLAGNPDRLKILDVGIGTGLLSYE
ncbi:MAG: hypothetical protein P1R58_00030 [bacterium]|nr:hypothetical protein [bacterium]